MLTDGTMGPLLQVSCMPVTEVLDMPDPPYRSRPRVLICNSKSGAAPCLQLGAIPSKASGLPVPRPCLEGRVRPVHRLLQSRTLRRHCHQPSNCKHVKTHSRTVICSLLHVLIHDGSCVAHDILAR